MHKQKKQANTNRSMDDPEALPKSGSLNPNDDSGDNNVALL